MYSTAIEHPAIYHASMSYPTIQVLQKEREGGREKEWEREREREGCHSLVVMTYCWNRLVVSSNPAGRRPRGVA